jgi:hypothetical protein
MYLKSYLILISASIVSTFHCGNRSLSERVQDNIVNVSKTIATNHILMIDVSPSMAPYLPSVLNGLNQAILNAAPDDVISVYVFWHDILQVMENVRVNDGNRQDLLELIASKLHITDGCTDVGKMLNFAQSKMSLSEKNFPYHRKMLLIFSDNQHAPYPCGGRNVLKLTASQVTDLESKASSVRRMGGWSKFVIYTPSIAEKETTYNQLPTDIGAKRIEYTDFKNQDSLKNILQISKWMLIIQMLAIFLIFLYFLFRMYFLSKILFLCGIFLLFLSASIFLVELLSGVDYLNTSIEGVTSFLVNYVSPYVGDHRLVLPLQFSMSGMMYLLIFMLIKRIIPSRPAKITSP